MFREEVPMMKTQFHNQVKGVSRWKEESGGKDVVAIRLESDNYVWYSPNG
jgi:hypothetical protein